MGHRVTVVIETTYERLAAIDGGLRIWVARCAVLDLGHSTLKYPRAGRVGKYGSPVEDL
jgi:hypothetical protein